MKTQTLTMEEIRAEGMEILAKKMGPVNMIRFMQQFDTGRGNYSQERHRVTGKMSMKEIVKEIGLKL